MNRESLVFAISGTMFGLLVGWIIGTQQGAGPAPAAAVAAANGAPAAQMPATPPPTLDVQRAADLERQANAAPANAAIRVDLGNLYFDAERFDMAISWYEAALKINPKDVNASTDLGVLRAEVEASLRHVDYLITELNRKWPFARDSELKLP